MTESPVLFDEHRARQGKVGVARLNAPRSLNAIGQSTIDLLTARLDAWADDPAIRCVVLDGAGDKGFCAGGDVIRLRAAILEGDAGRDAVRTFYGSEYALDHRIHTYEKPILCWGDGLVMGGGLGLLSGASHRVVTERSRLAMPEARIGFYPDAGATWFLNRLPGRIGLFLGLTGAPVGADDALLLGLADHRVPSGRYAAIRERLLETAWSGDPVEDRDRLSRLLRPFAEPVDAASEASPLRANRQAIAGALERRTTDGIVEELLGADIRDDWMAGAIDNLQQSSPTSLRVIVEQLRRGRHLSLSEAFRAELRLSLELARGPDFAEGVRALLVDKDGTPQWHPQRLDAVTAADVEGYFDRGPR